MGGRVWSVDRVPRPNNLLHLTAMNFVGSCSIIGTVAAGEQWRSAKEA
jgi:hypothetical protein